MNTIPLKRPGPGTVPDTADVVRSSAGMTGINRPVQSPSPSMSTPGGAAAAVPFSQFRPGGAAAAVPFSHFGPGEWTMAHPLSALESGSQAAAVVPFSSGELKEDDDTILLNVCFDVQKQIYKIKEFMFQFCTAIEREKKQNDQTKGNTDGDVGTSTVSYCIQQAISMMSQDGEIIKLQEMVSKIPDVLKRKDIGSLIPDALSLFDRLMRQSNNRSRLFLNNCLTGVTKLTAILNYASEKCDQFLANQKQNQADKERKAMIELKSERLHATAQQDIHANVLVASQDELVNTRDLLAQYMRQCSDDDTEWKSTSSLSASTQSSRFSCDTNISVEEVVELYDDTRMLLQITGDLQALSAALLMAGDIPGGEEHQYKTYLIDRAISGLQIFNNKSRRDTRKINNAAGYWLRSDSISGAQFTGNPHAETLQIKQGHESESDESYAESSNSSESSWSSAVSNPVDTTEHMGLTLDVLIPKQRLVVNIERAKEMDRVRKQRLSTVFNQIKAPNFTGNAKYGFLTILSNLVSQGKVHDSKTDEIKPLKLLIESDGTKTVGLSESFMDAKAQKATKFNVTLVWLREYVLRLKVDGMHDAQRASSGGASSGGDEEKESGFFKIFSKLNKKSAENMASRISDTNEHSEFVNSPFFGILQNPTSQFETVALRAMEERVLQQKKRSVITIDKSQFNSEGNGRLCIDNASTLDMSVIGAERLGMFSTLLDGGASNDCLHWMFGPRNCIYYAEANGTSLTLHICEIVTFKNGVYCINICIEIKERRSLDGSREHRYRTIHTLPLCDVNGKFKETFTPIELNKVCVLWNGIIDDVANGLMQHNALKILGPNVLKAIGDETQLWDTLISGFLKNGGLLPYYLHTKVEDTNWHTYNQFVTKFNEYIIRNNVLPTSSSNSEDELIKLFKRIASDIDSQNGTSHIDFIHSNCMKIILASNDRLNHAGTAHFHLGTMGCSTVLGHLNHTTKYENPHWKSLLTCCQGRVLASSIDGIVIKACNPQALGVTSNRQTGLDKGLVYPDESSVASGSNSSSIVSRGLSVNLELLVQLPIRRVYARQHAENIAKRNSSPTLPHIEEDIKEEDIKEIEDVLTEADELLPNPVLSALEINDDDDDDNDFHSVSGASGVNASQDLGSQLTPPYVPSYYDPNTADHMKQGGKRFGGSTKQVKNKSMKRKRSNSKKFPTKKKRQSKKKNTIKKVNNNVNIKHKNKTKKIKK